MKSNISRTYKLIKRLRYLWIMELFDSFFLPATLLFTAWRLQQPLGLFSIYSVALVAWILWQGAAYWRLKLQTLKTGAKMKSKHLGWFEGLKKINWALISLLPLMLTVRSLLNTAFVSSLDLVAGLGFYTLAVLEQINYYHYQLMYDGPADWRYLLTHRQLKRAKLYQDLQHRKIQTG